MKHPPHGKLIHDLKGIDPLSLEVFHAFKAAILRQRQLMLRIMADKGTHPAQAGCLLVLADHDGMSQRDLAENLHVSRPTVTTMLQKMERSGVIERRSDEADQRLTRIYLTDAGHSLAESVRAVYPQVLEIALGPMPAHDRREFLRLLESFNNNIDQALTAFTGPDREEDAPAC